MDYSGMKIQDLGKAKTDAQAKFDAIYAAASAAGRDFTEEEDVETAALLAQVKEIDGVIKKRNGAATKLAEMKSFSKADTSTRSSFAPSQSGVEVGNPRWMDDPKKGFAGHTDFFKAVIENPSPRHCENEALRFLSTAGSDEQSGSNDAYGGYFIPKGLLPGLQTVDPEVDFLAGRVRSIPMSTPEIHINARTDKDHTSSVSGGLRVYRRSEAAAVTASRLQTEQIRMYAESLMGVAYTTEELLRDSPISVAALISAGFQDEFGSKLINERINGTGVGQFEGIANSPALITVSKETGQAADTITYDNVLNMFARMWRPSSAVWIANQTCIPQLAKLAQTVGTSGVPAWQPSAREGLPSTLFGSPVYFTEYCEAVGDLGDIYYVNFGEYLEGTYQGIESAESIHVRFDTNERAFKFTMRNDGRCWWRSALTPKKGVTLSPFVTLAARA